MMSIGGINTQAATCEVVSESHHLTPPHQVQSIQQSAEIVTGRHHLVPMRRFSAQVQSSKFAEINSLDALQASYREALIA